MSYINTYVNNQSIIMLEIKSEPSKVPYEGNLRVRSPVLVQLKPPETLVCLWKSEYVDFESFLFHFMDSKK